MNKSDMNVVQHAINTGVVARLSNSHIERLKRPHRSAIDYRATYVYTADSIALGHTETLPRIYSARKD